LKIYRSHENHGAFLIVRSSAAVRVPGQSDCHAAWEDGYQLDEIYSYAHTRSDVANLLDLEARAACHKIGKRAYEKTKEVSAKTNDGDLTLTWQITCRDW
jgi:hypothetical protein